MAGRNKTDPAGHKTRKFALNLGDSLADRLEALAFAWQIDVASVVRLVLSENLKGYEQRVAGLDDFAPAKLRTVLQRLYDELKDEPGESEKAEAEKAKKPGRK